MSKRWLGLLLLGTWMSSSGCMGDPPAEPPVDVGVSPNPLPFGDVVVAQSSTKDAMLLAGGGFDATATVTLALEAGGDCSQFQVLAPTSPLTVDLFGEKATVKFAPTTPGDKSCTIDVNNVNDKNPNAGPLTSFTATGHAIAP